MYVRICIKEATPLLGSAFYQAKLAAAWCIIIQLSYLQEKHLNFYSTKI